MDNQPLESAFQRRVLADLGKLPNIYFHKHQAGSIRGIPDIVGSVSGVFFALELKRHRKALARPLQKYTLSKIEQSGALSFIVYPEVWGYVLTVLAKISVEKKNVQDLVQRVAKHELQNCLVETSNLN